MDRRMVRIGALFLAATGAWNVEGEVHEERQQADQMKTGLLRPLALLWLAGVMLRLTILALPPVLQAVETEFRLSGSRIGVLTAIPALFFALAAVPGAVLIGRFGAVPSLVTGLLISALGAAARGFAGGVIELELATSLMCLGVAIMQPAMPTLVREWTPSRVGLATATYTCGLLCGEVLPAAWPFAPVLPLVGGGWRATLFVWSLPVLATVPIILILQPHTAREHIIRASRSWPDWREGTVWKVGLLLGAVNAAYFGLNGFVPGWLSQSGGSDMIRPALLALNAAQIPASLLLLFLLDRLVFRRWSYVVAGLAMLAGSLGLAMGPAALAVTFAALAGFSLAWLLTLALALPPLLVDAKDVPSISAAVFTVSYAIAVLTALLTGILVTSGPSRSIEILPIAGAALAVVVVGVTMRRQAGQHSSDDRSAS